jgi:aspartyl-tRNA(Asn)/glutamyl-tRNA(Gln) amidotransferase subunit A
LVKEPGETMTTIADLSAAELTEAYRKKALSPVEVAGDVLTRVGKAAPFNAFRPIDADAVLAQAAASERRWNEGRPLGRADGLPATIKDNLWLKGHPTGRGSKTGDHSPAKADAPACARLREEGAVFIGKTTLPEYGWIGACHSPLTGITRNPWSPDHTPGGSTGGGAVAALLDLGVLHLGTDGAGSLRIPAAFTGVFGFKPSYGRVPAYPASPFSVLAHQGPIARRVADAAVMLSVISGPDVRDMTAWNTPAPDFTEGLDIGVRGLRVAFSARPGSAAVRAPEIEMAAQKAARVLEAEGAIVEAAEPPIERALDVIRAMWWPVAATIVDAVAEIERGGMDAGLRRNADRGRPTPLASYLAAANSGRAELYNAMVRFHERYDLLLTPTMPVTALKAGQEMPEQGAFGDDWLNWSPYTYPFNLTQQPAGSVPSGLARNGLPMGVQVVAPPRRDDLVLRAALVIERAMPMPKAQADYH